MAKKKNKKIKKNRRKKLQKKRKILRRKIRRGSSKDRNLYALDPNFEFFNELRVLILKSSPAEKDKMIKRIAGLGRVKLAVVSGIFMSNYNENPEAYTSDADLFIVGDGINKARLRSFLKSLEAEVGKEIRFGLMEKEEFEYRYGMFDRFVRVLLEGPHEKLINKLGL
ncbi:MAG: hypothetical protein A3B99_00645 [Candidatus Yanofskybacteria bacterium RIFCSPHIGHO2_02_FULL_44_12b]|nr:MAG: hypothetical protein A2659_02185 [Candidatus Yanofskybacteria bacterium RIFCSPHIGHO2_01_FULL_44_24]OGN15987.1 MAG: hypothetical protein A3B99_00645 [Candidatus Yanofskybacteria bacterium RIFCSPHIGHO2_02_FULL_44_12b]OGN25498.1 MAG: hypothetical protein A2925_02090 [Candidatus Yanofskybacteria bacterium RIFCSPLOWO2_01_FULL_44_22]